MTDKPSTSLSPNTLYLLATPLGNLADVTFRAVEVLRAADIIACEDTRRTHRLLAHYQISNKRLIAFFAAREKMQINGILNLLSAGKSVVLVSDAGMPAVSDPGTFLVAAARRAGFAVIPIPGPSAVVSALAVSGGGAGGFTFLGFLPRNKGKIIKEVGSALGNAKRGVVFFESPHRIHKTLDILLNSAEAGKEGLLCLLAREMTKLHETYLQGTLKQVIGQIQNQTLLGEITVVLWRDKSQHANEEESE